MENKTCFKCKTEKAIDCFSFKSKAKGTRNDHCKDCHKLFRRTSYLKNRDKEIERAKGNQKKFREWFKTIKPDTCSKCGFKHVAVIDLHHTDENKEMNVSAMVRYAGKAKLLKEISKCIPLCANCHRIHHYNEKHASMVFNGSTKPFQG